MFLFGNMWKVCVVVMCFLKVGVLCYMKLDSCIRKILLWLISFSVFSGVLVVRMWKEFRLMFRLDMLVW